MALGAARKGTRHTRRQPAARGAGILSAPTAICRTSNSFPGALAMGVAVYPTRRALKFVRTFLPRGKFSLVQTRLNARIGNRGLSS